MVLAELTVRAEHHSNDVKRQAIEQIYELAYKVGAKAAAAIPVLIGGLVDLDPKIGESSLWALKYCAPDSIDPLVECLSHQMSFVRERAAHSLGNIGDDARAAAPKLLELLNDPDQAVRQRAAWALGLMHDSRPETVTVLARMMSEGTVEAWAAYALGEMGPVAVEALSELRAGMCGGEEPFRGCCAIAVALIANDLESLPYMVATLSSEHPHAPRRAAAMALAEFGPAASDAVGALEALIDDEDSDVGDAAMAALSAIRGVSH